MTIETERLRLRGWTEADIAPFTRHTNTPAVMRWLGGIQSEAEMREMADTFAAWDRAQGFTFWLVERKADGELLGFCGLKRANGEGCAFVGDHEIGWRLREDVWGQGYAKEAAIASLDYAFGPLAAPHVVALTCIQNEASWGLMERLGMTRRADLDYVDPRFPGELSPAIVYRIERSDWRA